MQDSIIGTHHPAGQTISAICQSTREGNAIVLGRQNLAERHDNSVFVDLNIDDDDDDETAATSKAAYPY